MIVVLKPNADPGKQEQLTRWLEEMGVRVHVAVGDYQIVLGLIGNTDNIDAEVFALGI